MLLHLQQVSNKVLLQFKFDLDKSSSEAKVYGLKVRLESKLLIE